MFEIKKCTLADLSRLQQIASATYIATFRDMCRSEDMAAYLNASFCNERLQKELANVASSFFFICKDGFPAGYLKVNESAAQTDLYDPVSLELERIYVIPAFQGQGLGGCLLKHAETEGRKRGKAYVWLGVWEKNENALDFYKSQGFYKIGEHRFVMGKDVQNDFLLRKDLCY